MRIENPTSTRANENLSEVPWHIREPLAVATELRTDVGSGLSQDEAASRLSLYGSNTIQEYRRRSPLRMLLDQFTDFMIVVLIVAAIISGLIGEPPDAIAIMVIVLLNGVIGFIQEYRAEQAVAALRLLAAPHAKVLRSGKVHDLPGAQLVPGDVVIMEAGDGVPADLRLFEAVHLTVDEAALTGESIPSEKQMEPLPDNDRPIGDRRNMAYKGTSVTNGRGSGVVVGTGMKTELGKIAALLSQEEMVKTPLQKRLAQFGQRLALAAIAICVIVFVVGVLRGESVLIMFLTSVSLAVAAIPEALPAVVTVSLALGARRMVKKEALIRRLPAVETLGSVTYICTDKTGTLTQNKMRVDHVYVDGRVESQIQEAGERNPWHLFGQALALNSDAHRKEDGTIQGDPTEVALSVAAQEAGFDKEQCAVAAPRLAEIPFDSVRKCMTTLHRDRHGLIAFTKGAPEQVVKQCTAEQTGTGLGPFDQQAILTKAEEMAAAGLRVLAVAFRRWPEIPSDLSPEYIERDLTFLGLAGLMDPPRPEAQDSVSLCKTAGITPIMITGDHPATARAIAQRLGIIERDGEILTGRELARFSEEELRERAGKIHVYARVAPEQKIRIVKALQDKGEFVSMTGDGVNDAPALKRADIGVAMGLVGTDVARQASDMILLDDNFATMVTAVREGRRIFDNIRRFIKYTMTSNAGEIWTIFLAPFLGLPIPLLPIHILWINLVTDGLPGLALASEPEERGIMQRPPRPPNESIFAHGMWQDILWVGLLMGGVSLFTQAWAYHTGSAHWQTMVFTVLTLSQMGNVLAIRSEHESFFTLGAWSNRPLLGAVLLTFGLQMATIYIPFLNPIFKTQPLDGPELILCLILSSVVFMAVEVQKWMIRRQWLVRT